MASATRHRSGGSHSEEFDSRFAEPDDVARPTLEDLAAQPQLQLLHVTEAVGPSGRAATTLASSAWNDREETRHAVAGRFGLDPSRGASTGHSKNANQLGPSRSATRLLAALAAAAWLSGCSTASVPDRKEGNCLQAAAGQSFEAPAPDDVSTEGGGLGHFDGRARDVVPVPVVRETVGAGGAASNLESTRSGGTARDRSGLVDAWPEVGPPRTDLTTRSVLSKG